MTPRELDEKLDKRFVGRIRCHTGDVNECSADGEEFIIHQRLNTIRNLLNDIEMWTLSRCR